MRHSPNMPRFHACIGIDYSGAKTPVSRLSGLQVYRACSHHTPTRVHPPVRFASSSLNWTRQELAHWLVERLSEQPSIVGIDHGFGFPLAYLRRYRLKDWDQFLDDFVKHWPTHQPGVCVDDLRRQNPRIGSTRHGLRLTERWTSSAKCVFQFDCQGSVAKSTHAGLPWLRFLRHHPCLSGKLHFWPFDGFEVPPGKSVLVEVYPSMLRNRYPRGHRTVDQQDAYAIARWLRQADDRDVLAGYFNPPLTPAEQHIARQEGWILGVT